VIYALGDRVPQRDGNASYVCPSAQVIGSVRLAEGSSVWSRLSCVGIPNGSSWERAGSLVPPRMVVPDGTVVMGSPARVVREVTPRDLEMIAQASAHYVKRSAEFRQRLRPMET
jgi:carbonic anhydrase/acetyltransferase-like protein (isoleucine patch superfamily)